MSSSRGRRAPPVAGEKQPHGRAGRGEGAVGARVGDRGGSTWAPGPVSRDARRGSRPGGTSVAHTRELEEDPRELKEDALELEAGAGTWRRRRRTSWWAANRAAGRPRPLSTAEEGGGRRRGWRDLFEMVLNLRGLFSKITNELSLRHVFRDGGSICYMSLTWQSKA